MYKPTFSRKDTEKHGLKLTLISLQPEPYRKVEIWHPNKFHSDYHIEFAHTTITGVTDMDPAVVKATKLLWEYPML